MSFNVILRHEAELDLIDAVKWYEENLKGLGSNFLLNVEAAIQSLSRNPQAYPRVYKNIHRTLIRKFPFGIHYIIEEKQIIILAIFHFSRSPKNWKSRLQ